ncbi:SAM-dependent methyltransferase [Streptomyces sp. NPDC050560]|uniref:SAM-dependent methyltransferase n=1 Tax=Streptomyces sp. NPDC050560 TaxID=3365630 RepID=UPI00378ACF3F
MSVPPDDLKARLQTDRPHSARVWNFLLGGKDNYPPDSEIGEMILKTFPEFTAVARLQRHFLARAVRYLVGTVGIRQLLDVGTGLPTADNTHELAQRIAPESRIVYVDNDPLVLTHARALLKSAPEGACAYVDADVRDPGRIIEEAKKTLDFSRPIGLTMVAIMGQISDEEDPTGIVDTLVSALPSGSYLALSDGTDTNERLKAAVAAYNSESVNTYHLRSLDRIGEYFHGLELVEPGVVPTAEWRPDLSTSIEVAGGGHAGSGVARKP